MKKPLYKVLICGDRNWDNMEAIENAIKGLVIWTEHVCPGGELLIITGGASGADTMARIAAHKLNVHCAEVKALWDTRHQGAGPQRNTIMLSMNPNAVLAFHHDIDKSKGTKNMILQAKKAGVDTQVIS